MHNFKRSLTLKVPENPYSKGQNAAFRLGTVEVIDEENHDNDNPQLQANNDP